jgi:hypothetical protein
MCYQRLRKRSGKISVAVLPNYYNFRFDNNPNLIYHSYPFEDNFKSGGLQRLTKFVTL